jgi:hypothetical protein
MKVQAIHLTRYSEFEEYHQLCIDNDLINLDAEYLFKLSEDGYTKVFIDSETHKIIGLVHHTVKKDIIFNDEFISNLKNLPSLTIKSKQTNYQSGEQKRDRLDVILDKISKSGIESLSTNERKFLDSLK